MNTIYESNKNQNPLGTVCTFYLNRDPVRALIAAPIPCSGEGLRSVRSIHASNTETQRSLQTGGGVKPGRSLNPARPRLRLHAMMHPLVEGTYCSQR